MLTEKDFEHFRENARDEQGRFRTQSLFLETNQVSDKYPPLFTLKDYNHKGLPSLKLIYLSYDHVPGHEYQFAMDVFGSWQHWQKLFESRMRDTFLAWQEELEVKMAAKGYKSLALAAKNPEKGIAAAKFLADRGWKQKRGRPSKEEVERERRVQAGIKNEFESDIERIGLSLVKGNK